MWYRIPRDRFLFPPLFDPGISQEGIGSGQRTSGKTASFSPKGGATIEVVGKVGAHQSIRKLLYEEMVNTGGRNLLTKSNRWRMT